MANNPSNKDLSNQIGSHDTSVQQGMQNITNILQGQANGKKSPNPTGRKRSIFDAFTSWLPLTNKNEDPVAKAIQKNQQNNLITKLDSLLTAIRTLLNKKDQVQIIVDNDKIQQGIISGLSQGLQNLFKANTTTNFGKFITNINTINTNLNNLSNNGITISANLTNSTIQTLTAALDNSFNATFKDIDLTSAISEKIKQIDLNNQQFINKFSGVNLGSIVTGKIKLDEINLNTLIESKFTDKIDLTSAIASKISTINLNTQQFYDKFTIINLTEAIADKISFTQINLNEIIEPQITVAPIDMTKVTDALSQSAKTITIQGSTTTIAGPTLTTTNGEPPPPPSEIKVEVPETVFSKIGGIQKKIKSINDAFTSKEENTTKTVLLETSEDQATKEEIDKNTQIILDGIRRQTDIIKEAFEDVSQNLKKLPDNLKPESPVKQKVTNIIKETSLITGEETGQNRELSNLDFEVATDTNTTPQELILPPIAQKKESKFDTYKQLLNTYSTLIPEQFQRFVPIIQKISDNIPSFISKRLDRFLPNIEDLGSLVYRNVPGLERPLNRELPPVQIPRENRVLPSVNVSPIAPPFFENLQQNQQQILSPLEVTPNYITFQQWRTAMEGEILPEMARANASLLPEFEESFNERILPQFLADYKHQLLPNFMDSFNNLTELQELDGRRNRRLLRQLIEKENPTLPQFQITPTPLPTLLESGGTPPPTSPTPIIPPLGSSGASGSDLGGLIKGLGTLGLGKGGLGLAGTASAGTALAATGLAAVAGLGAYGAYRATDWDKEVGLRSEDAAMPKWLGGTYIDGAMANIDHYLGTGLAARLKVFAQSGDWNKLKFWDKSSTQLDNIYTVAERKLAMAKGWDAADAAMYNRQDKLISERVQEAQKNTIFGQQTNQINSIKSTIQYETGQLQKKLNTEMGDNQRKQVYDNIQENLNKQRNLNNLQQKEAVQAIKYDSSLVLKNIVDSTLDQGDTRDRYTKAISLLDDPYSTNELNENILPPSIKIVRDFKKGKTTNLDDNVIENYISELDQWDWRDDLNPELQTWLKSHKITNSSQFSKHALSYHRDTIRAYLNSILEKRRKNLELKGQKFDYKIDQMRDLNIPLTEINQNNSLLSDINPSSTTQNMRQGADVMLQESETSIGTRIQGRDIIRQALSFDTTTTYWGEMLNTIKDIRKDTKDTKNKQPSVFINTITTNDNGNENPHSFFNN